MFHRSKKESQKHLMIFVANFPLSSKVERNIHSKLEKQWSEIKKKRFSTKEKECAKKKIKYQTIDLKIKGARIEISTVTQMQLAISYISALRMQSFSFFANCFLLFFVLEVLTIFNDNFFWHPSFKRISVLLSFLKRFTLC